MPTTDELSQQLAGGGNVDEIRLGLAELIGQRLREFNDADVLGYWEKEHLAHAIATLAINVRLGPDSPAWLRICLTDIMKAEVPAEDRNEDYIPKNPQIEALTFNDLIRALRTVGG